MATVGGKPHEPTDACARYHCFWHNVDEAVDGYMLCYECKHMYPTEAELVATYIEGLPVGYSRDGITGVTIVFCPLCSHDF